MSSSIKVKARIYEIIKYSQSQELQHYEGFVTQFIRALHVIAQIYERVRRGIRRAFDVVSVLQVRLHKFRSQHG